MSGPSAGAPRPTGTARRAEARRRSTMERFAQTSDTSGFHAGSTMFAGLLLYGGLGWLLDRWLGTAWLLPVGILFGAGLSFWTLWLRYGVVRPKPPTEAGLAAPLGSEEAPAAPTTARSDRDRPMEDDL